VKKKTKKKSGQSNEVGVKEENKAIRMGQKIKE